jgi:hypothetical protein
MLVSSIGSKKTHDLCNSGAWGLKIQPFPISRVNFRNHKCQSTPYLSFISMLRRKDGRFAAMIPEAVAGSLSTFSSRQHKNARGEIEHRFLNLTIRQSRVKLLLSSVLLIKAL